MTDKLLTDTLKRGGEIYKDQSSLSSLELASPTWLTTMIFTHGEKHPF